MRQRAAAPRAAGSSRAVLFFGRALLLLLRLLRCCLLVGVRDNHLAPVSTLRCVAANGWLRPAGRGRRRGSAGRRRRRGAWRSVLED